MASLMAYQLYSASDRVTQSNVTARLIPKQRRRDRRGWRVCLVIHRFIRAYGRRVAARDDGVMADMTGLAAELDEATSRVSPSSAGTGTHGPT